jgi:putative phosphoribosyl transferase
MITIFRDRRDAGKTLAAALGAYANRDDVVVLGLPRGGVPVAFEVALALSAPLDVFVVRKLGVPGHEEWGFGAIATGGVRVLDIDVIDRLRLADSVVEEITAREASELARRERLYRDDRPAPDVTGKTVVVVDDGLATGSTMRAAVEALRGLGPGRIVAAVPTGARKTCEELSFDADEVVCATWPESFYAVGQHYEDFSPTTDEEVCRLLAMARRSRDHGDAGDRAA